MSPADYENELKRRDETIARLEAEIRELKKLLADKAEARTPSVSWSSTNTISFGMTPTDNDAFFTANNLLGD